MSVLVIAVNNLRRLIRERAYLFFVFVLPLALIRVLGVTLEDDQPRIGVHVEDGVTPGAQQLIDGLEDIDGVGVEVFDDLRAATGELEREDITALIVVHLLDLLATRELAPVIADRVPLADAARAHDLLERGTRTGKVVLVTDTYTTPRRSGER